MFLGQFLGMLGRCQLQGRGSLFRRCGRISRGSWIGALIVVG